MSVTVPPHLRPIAFGLTELLLDLVYGLQRYARVDLDSLHILLCVLHATMRPYMTDPAAPVDLTAPRVPASKVGSISRRAIADKTGLPRETVRRKVADLAAAGLLTIAGNASVRTPPLFAQGDLQRTVMDLHDAVLRYGRRLAAFGMTVGWETSLGAGTEVVPRHVRPIAFALTALVLDLLYSLQRYCKVDLEAVYVLLCVTDATMRPFMIDPATPESVMAAVTPGNDVRGAISRRSIADKTGLPRETVRRRITELAALGLVQIDGEDRVRSAQRMDDPAFQRTLEDGHETVLRYFERLSAGRDGL